MILKNNKDSYSNEDITQLEKFEEIFSLNLAFFVDPKDVEFIEFGSVITYHNLKIQENYRLFPNEFPTKNNKTKADHLKMLVVAFEDILMMYLICKNYQIDKGVCVEFLINYMFHGGNFLAEKLKKNNFFLMNYNQKMIYIRDKIMNRKIIVKEEPSCPFHKSPKKQIFVEKVWTYIDIYYFPMIQNRFSNQVSEFKNKIDENQSDIKEQGFIGLFFIGLLGAYERGEVN